MPELGLKGKRQIGNPENPGVALSSLNHFPLKVLDV